MRAEPLRILVVSQNYWPDLLAAGQLMTDVCEDLAVLGHEVTVVCGQHDTQPRTGSAPRTATERRNGVRVVRVWSHDVQRKGISERLVHYGSFFASSMISALCDEVPDVCLVISSPPLLLGFSGTLLKLLRGVPFVYAVHDLYPDVAYHLGVLSERSLLARLIEPSARALYRAASAVITLSTDMRGRLIAKGVSPERIRVVPNWADPDEIRPIAKDNLFSQEFPSTCPFVIQYSGNLGLSQGLEALIGAARLLRDLPIAFSFVGDGNARQSLVQLAKEHHLPNVTFAPPQARTRLSAVLGSADVGTVLMRQGFSGDLVPCKLYGIMASAKPVLAAVEATSEVARVVEQHQCGWVVAPESPAALAEGIVTAWRCSEMERTRLGENGRRACIAHYARRSLTLEYHQVLLSVAKRRGTLASRSEKQPDEFRC